MTVTENTRKCASCKYSAVCLSEGVESFAKRFLRCDCGNMFLVKLPENYKGAAKLLECGPALCAEALKHIQVSEYCVYCYNEKFGNHELYSVSSKRDLPD